MDPATQLNGTVSNAGTHIPQQDGLNVDPFLFFEVPIHMALFPPLSYLHVWG